MPVAKKRGRPAFKPTPAMRRTVEQMVSVGDSQITISRALGIAKDTLELHFAEELKNGYAKKRREIVELLYKNAKKGNVTAQRTLLGMTGTTGAAADFDQKTGKDEASGKPVAGSTAVKRGKKEIQREEAFAAGQNSEWGEDLAPLPGTRPN